MQRLKMFGLALLALVALTAVTTATASAALPEALDNLTNPFTAVGKKGETSKLEISGKAGNIECTASSSTGKISGAKTGTIEDVMFTGCTALGFSANSLGDKPGIILLKNLPMTLCYTNEATKTLGAIVELPAAVHIEIPIISALINVIGAVVASLNEPNKLKTGVFSLSFIQKEGVQEFTKCSGKEAKLLSSKDAKHEENKQSGELTIQEATFEKDIEFMA